MSKKRATFNLSEKLLERLDNLPRKLLPNKSHLVEELLEKWLENAEIEKAINEVEKKLS
jgi:predicted DNA-binding protein